MVEPLKDKDKDHFTEQDVVKQTLKRKQPPANANDKAAIAISLERCPTSVETVKEKFGLELVKSNKPAATKGKLFIRPFASVNSRGGHWRGSQ